MENVEINSFHLSYKDFPIICRICLNKGILTEFVKSDILNIFQNITDIKIEPDDNLPKNICSACIYQLESISSFINVSKNNDINLKRVLNSSVKQPCDEESLLEIDAADESDEHLDYSDDDKVTIKCEVEETDLEIFNNIKEVSPKSSQCKKNYKRSLRQSTKGQPSECEICGESFNTKSQLTEHHKKNINCRSRQFKCIHCEKAFYTKFRLKLHMRSHTKETPFECKICFKKFRHSPNLKRHDDIVHKGLKPFKCDVCGKEYSRKATRNEHMHTHTGERPYICIYCGKSFQRYSSHFSHVYCHRINNGEVPENIPKPDTLKNLDFLKLQCVICNKSFSSRSAVFQHSQLHGEKHFLCTICGRAFSRKCQLDDHFKMHTGEKPHVCKYCGKSFRLISGYKNHILIHTGEKPYQCKICLKSFVQSVHLTRHMRIHTGEKPYSCQLCGKGFAQKCNLKVHARIHTGETPYHCVICGIGFYDSSNMKKHQKGHTIENESLNSGNK